MRYNVASTLTNLFGTVIRQTPDPTSPDATVRSVLVQALLNSDPRADGETKYKLHKLASRIQDVTDFVTLSAEEVTQIKRIVGESYPVGVVGPLFDFLEAPDFDRPITRVKEAVKYVEADDDLGI